MFIKTDQSPHLWVCFLKKFLILSLFDTFLMVLPLPPSEPPPAEMLAPGFLYVSPSEFVYSLPESFWRFPLPPNATVPPDIICLSFTPAPPAPCSYSYTAFNASPSSYFVLSISTSYAVILSPNSLICSFFVCSF